MELALYLASIGFVGIWFASGRDQLGQPKKYMKFIIEHSYLKYMIEPKDLLKESVVFKNEGSLALKNLTELNARSGRADFLIYDEEAQADEDAYNAAVNILAGSPLGIIIHISTACKATVFEKNHDRIKTREITTGEQFVFTTRWDEIARFRANKEWYDEQKKILPDWYYRQEHCAEFTLPMGAVFQNVIYDPYTVEVNRMIDGMPKCSGVDWNPAAGHVRSTVRWSDKYDAVVVVGEAMFSTGYARELKKDEFYALAPFFTNGNRIVLEDGGINIPYIDWFYDMHEEFKFNWSNQQYTTEEWDNQDIHKMAACIYIIQNGITIYCDKIRFPKTAKQIEECSWDKDALGNPKLKKDPANSPHYMDAFLHAVSELNRDQYEYEAISF